ncbi:MAG: two-component system alkaline phosphatase synthesis response regulator PhoP [Pseudohongiellaceae bacterium]|jgi:DNA-binding response OmpR family regulator
MQNKQIVVVEDEPDILEVLCYNLKREGYQVFESLDGREGLALIEQKVPDIVILDLMLPGIDGLEICRKLKSNSRTQHIPIIMVTAKGEESDVVLGLGVGADDYIPKPFSPKELIARVKAVLRRGVKAEQPMNKGRIDINGLEIDSRKHQVRIDGNALKMTASEFRLLFCLASHPGQVFSREQLLNHTTSEEVAVVDRNIDVHIRSIRKKIGDNRSFIETIRGVGYRFLDF